MVQTREVHFRVTVDEFERLKADVAESGKKHMADYIRDEIFKKSIQLRDQVSKTDMRTTRMEKVQDENFRTLLHVQKTIDQTLALLEEWDRQWKINKKKAGEQS